MSKPLPLGIEVPPYGKVSAVGFLQGERYYWLIDKHGTVSMMPADIIEPRPHPSRRASHARG